MRILGLEIDTGVVLDSEASSTLLTLREDWRGGRITLRCAMCHVSRGHHSLDASERPRCFEFSEVEWVKILDEGQTLSRTTRVK